MKAKILSLVASITLVANVGFAQELDETAEAGNELASESAQAQSCSTRPICVSLGNSEMVEVHVTGDERNFAQPPVEGFGGHFSSTPNTDGYGGYHAECHLITSGGKMTVWCYDGYQDQSHHANHFRLDLGPLDDTNRDGWQPRLIDVTYFVTRRQVKVQATAIAMNGYTSEKHPYFVESTFPIRESSGFWRTGQFCYKANSVLNNRTGRCGWNYEIDVLFH
jgi:hypothetical protein